MLQTSYHGTCWHSEDKMTVLIQQFMYIRKECNAKISIFVKSTAQSCNDIIFLFNFCHKSCIMVGLTDCIKFF